MFAGLTCKSLWKNTIFLQKDRGAVDMTDEFVMKAMSEATYQKKEGTASSYYWQNGGRMLPGRMSISKDSITNVRRKGRNLQKIAGQCVANFKKDEESPLKVCKPYTLRTQIWLQEDFLEFIGYGTIGITGEDGKIYDTGDLVVFYAEDDNWNVIRIFIFNGMGVDPDKRDEAMRYASKMV